MLEEYMNHRIGEDNVINLGLNNEDGFLKEIDNIINEISLGVESSLFLAYDSITLFHSLLKRIVLSYIVKKIKVDDNKHYRVKLNLNGELYNFLVVKITNDKLGTGYAIDYIYF